MKKLNLNGIIPACITTFSQEGKIDIISMKNHIKYLIKNGIKSVLILGSTGEFAYINFDEKVKLIQEIGKFLSSSYPDVQYIVGISSTNLKESIELGEIAYKSSANAVIAILETYFPLEKDQIISYYAELSNNLKIPLIAYNFPLVSGVDLLPKILVELAETGAIIGVKETAVPINIIKELLEEAPEDFTTIIGTDMMLKGSIEIGIRSAILGSGNYIPRNLVQYFSAVEQNDINEQLKIWKIISKKISILTYGLNLLPSIIKEAVILSGSPIPPYVRRPLPMVSEKLRNKIKRVLLK